MLATLPFLALAALGTPPAPAPHQAGVDATASLPLPQPAIRASEGGFLRTTLTVQNSRLPFAGRTIEVGAYEGTLPGPTLRVHPGDQIEILLINRLARIAESGASAPDRAAAAQSEGAKGAAAALPFAKEAAPREVCAGARPEDLPVGMAEHGAHGAGPRHLGVAAASGENPEGGADLWTNLHTHGLQVSPSGNSDNPFLRIRPGESCRYQIRVPADQPGGLYWYHPHLHGNTAKQAWAGMSGALIVAGALDRVPEVQAAEDRILLLEEIWVDRRGHVPAGIPLPAAGEVPFTTLPATPADQYLAVNGVLQPRLAIRPGEVQRWRIAATGPHRFFLLELEGHPFTLIARDGLPLARAETVDRVLLAPGNRVEVMVRGASPGSYRLRALAYDEGRPGGALPERLLATLVSAGKPAPMRLPGRLVPPPPAIAASAVQARRTLAFNGEMETVPPRFSLNGHAFEMGKVDFRVRAGATEEWTLRNHDAFHHPFHLHINPFQVVEVNGRPVEPPTWWDTYPLPPRGEVKIRVHFRADLPGRTVYHCHILPHEDAGMMGVLEIEPAGEPNARVTPADPRTSGAPNSATEAGFPSPFALDSIQAGTPSSAQPLSPPSIGEVASGAPLSADSPSGAGRPGRAPAPSNTFVFTRAHDGQVQEIAVDATLEVQLPGGPSTWTLTPSAPTVRPLGPPFPLPDPDGLGGGETIYVFRFAVEAPGVADLVGEETDPRRAKRLGAFRVTVFALKGIMPASTQ